MRYTSIMEIPQFWRKVNRPAEKPKVEPPPDVEAAAREGNLLVNSLPPDALSNVPNKIGKTGSKESLPLRPDTIPRGIEDMTNPPDPIDGIFRK